MIKETKEMIGGGTGFKWSDENQAACSVFPQHRSILKGKCWIPVQRPMTTTQPKSDQPHNDHYGIWSSVGEKRTLW